MAVRANFADMVQHFLMMTFMPPGLKPQVVHDLYLMFEMQPQLFAKMPPSGFTITIVSGDKPVDHVIEYADKFSMFPINNLVTNNKCG